MSGVEIPRSALHQVWLRANQVYDIMVFGTVKPGLECRKHGAGAGGRSQASVHLFHTSASCSGLLVIVLQTLLQRVDSFLKELEALLFLPAQKVQPIVFLSRPRGRGNCDIFIWIFGSLFNAHWLVSPLSVVVFMRMIDDYHLQVLQYSPRH